MNTQAIIVFDIDGVIRDVSGSYRRALADTVEYFTAQAYRPTSADIDKLKSEGIWNNDWEASQELIYRYFEGRGRSRSQLALDYSTIVAFFQDRYRGPDDRNWTGYICSEPLLLTSAYLESLTQAGMPWGFFSGAMRDEALYVLTGKLGIENPALIAMEDAPGKPDPTGLFAVVDRLQQQYGLNDTTPVIYVGDTVADLYTVEKARNLQPSRRWLGVGILPPHVQETESHCEAYTATLQKARASTVFKNVQALTPLAIQQLMASV